MTEIIKKKRTRTSSGDKDYISNKDFTKAIADWIEEAVKKQCDEPPYKHEGRSASQWVLIDYVNVVVHVFQSETRKFYKLEEMWSDGVAEEEKEEQAEAPAKKAPAKRAKKTIK